MGYKLRVQYWPIDKVKPYPNNPRDNDDAVEYVANSIREFSFQQPIVVDNNGTIIAGHTRHKAAKSLGMDIVPVVVADNLTPEQVNAYRLADNKVSEAASWDYALLGDELSKITDIDMGLFDFQPIGDMEPDVMPDIHTRELREVRRTFFLVSCTDDNLEEVRRMVQEAGSLEGVEVGAMEKYYDS